MSGVDYLGFSFVEYDVGFVAVCVVVRCFYAQEHFIGWCVGVVVVSLRLLLSLIQAFKPLFTQTHETQINEVVVFVQAAES